MAPTGIALAFVFAAGVVAANDRYEPLGLVCKLPEGGEIILAPIAAQPSHRPPTPEGYGQTLYGLNIASKLLANDLFCRLPLEAAEPATTNYCARFDSRGKILGAVATFPHDKLLDLVTDLDGISSYVVPLRNCAAKRIHLPQ